MPKLRDSIKVKLLIQNVYEKTIVMRSTGYIKEFGIVFSYVSMLLMCYLFDWKAYGIFISYLIEVIVLLLFYTFFRVREEKRNPVKYQKYQPILNLYVGIVPLVLFQYFIIGLMTVFIDAGQDFFKTNLLLSKEIYYSVASIVILYFINAVQISENQERIRTFQDDFIFKVMALTGTNILGVVFVLGFEVHSLLIVLAVMVMTRVGLEFYFIKR